MTPVWRNRALALSALLGLGGVLSYLAWGGIEENLVYFWDVDQLLDRGEQAYGATVRLGGVVEKGSVNWNTDTLDLSFRASSKPEGGRSVLVRARGAPPQMFREGIGVVVEGSYNGTVFAAERVIVKHSNEYRPPAPGEEPQKVYKTLIADEPQAAR